MLWLWMTAAIACPPDHGISFADVQIAWHVDGDVLHGQVSAPGPGWVAVGFNDRADLAGSRLLMFAVQDGVLRAEEHRAEPPNHPLQRVIPPDNVMGELTDRGLQVTFQIPLEDRHLTLQSGDDVWLTLAWSREPDFSHHSARRQARWVRL